MPGSAWVNQHATAAPMIKHMNSTMNSTIITISDLPRPRVEAPQAEATEAARDRPGGDSFAPPELLEPVAQHLFRGGERRYPPAIVQAVQLGRLLGRETRALDRGNVLVRIHRLRADDEKVQPFQAWTSSVCH